jgi:hypothetical protein
MDTPSDVGVYKLDFEAKLQERLNKPATWKEVCDVRFSSAYAINLPYMSTEFVAQTGTRGTAYGFSDFTLANEQLNIATYKTVPVFADEADFAQCSYIDQMDIADRSGKLLSDQIETAVLADHAAWTNVGDSSGTITSGVTTAITVTATNIDDVVRGIRRIATVANGSDLMSTNGLFFVWRPADFEALEQFAQANGYNLADAALKNGIDRGYFLMGAYHYVSNSHATGGHVFAGVKRIHKVGVLRQTWGKLKVTEDPGLQSGKGFITRADFGVKTPTGLATILYDVNVA